MPKIAELLDRWPLLQQFRNNDWRATGETVWSERTQTLSPKNTGAQVARSVCPYCAVGCGQLVFHKGEKLISIEGDPDSPHSRGRLCPKGSDSFELVTHSRRITKVKYRAPYATEWQEIPLDDAMEMVAQRVWDTRIRTFNATKDGYPCNNVTAICHLGGATLDNEENYLIKKLFTGGLGIVTVSNQARI
jgi:formate dehydrogenase major subunit